MIEIIQHAHRKPTRKIAECKNCGCVFTFDETDITRIMANQYDGYPYDDFLSLKCPECHKLVKAGFISDTSKFISDFQDYCKESENDTHS